MAVSEGRKGVPVWVLIVLWLGAAMPLLFGVLGYVSPGTLFATTWRAFPAPGSVDLTGPLGFYMARNLAMVAGQLYALAARSVPMFRLVLLMRIVSESFDGIHYIVAHGPIGPTVVPLILAGIEMAALLRIQAWAD